MNKILFIDDKIERMSYLLKKNNLDITKYNFLEIANQEVIKNVINDFYNKNFEFTLNFKTLIIHKSLLTNELIHEIRIHCKKNKINLILYSGDVIEYKYENDGDFEFLLINDKLLYTKNFELFLNSNDKKISNIVNGSKYHFIMNAISLLSNYLLMQNFEESEIHELIHKINFELKSEFSPDNLNKNDIINILNELNFQLKYFS